MGRRRRRPVRRAAPPHINTKEEPAEGGQDLPKQPIVTTLGLNMDLSVDLPITEIGERRDEAPKMMGSSDGAKEIINGSSIMESLSKKRIRKEEMEGKADDGYSKSLNTDIEQLSGSAPADTPIIVTGLKSFSFHKILGEGTFGKVMLATHPSCRHQLAVKMVKKRCLVEYFPENVQIERQVLEMTAKSPLFTRAHAIFQTQDYAFFIMEYLAGGDLRTVMWAYSPFPTKLTRFFAAEIICGLQFLHSRGIVHRDIKPENILLDSAAHVKIADFGLAVMNIFDDRKISEYAGTLKYMAPEILLDNPYNTAVDWFSAGVMFYEMATGKYPFYAGTGDKKIKRSLIKDVPTYPESLNPLARDLIDGLLNKSPESRQVAARGIREHLFFLDINWTDIEGAKARPPVQILVNMRHNRNGHLPQDLEEDKMLEVNNSALQSHVSRRSVAEDPLCSTRTSKHRRHQAMIIHHDLFS